MIILIKGIESTTFDKVLIKGKFDVSNKQMYILNEILKNVRKLCLNLGCVGSAVLFEDHDIMYLRWCDAEYAVDGGTVYKDNKIIQGKEATTVKTFIEKTIGLVLKYLPMPVKSITFAVYDGDLKSGEFSRAMNEPSSMAFILR